MAHNYIYYRVQIDLGKLLNMILVVGTNNIIGLQRGDLSTLTKELMRISAPASSSLYTLLVYKQELLIHK